MTALAIRPLETREEAEACARMMAGTEPWITLRRDDDACLRVVLDETRERYVALRRRPARRPPDPEPEGRLRRLHPDRLRRPGVPGHGRRHRARRLRRGAHLPRPPERLHLRLGLQPRRAAALRAAGVPLVGELHDYVVAGHSELLLRKTRGPLVP